MIYNRVKLGHFIKKLNRFVAIVEVNNMEIEVHIKNTGRLKELLVKGAKVVLEESDNPNRKTKFDLVSVYKDGNLVNIDSQILNYVAYEEIKKGKIISNANNIKREFTYKNSRFDLYFEIGEQKCLMEIKGVNLVKDNTALFPDAPTKRGSKHIEELIDASKNGFKTYILFLISLDYVSKFSVNKEMDFDFYNNIIKATKNNVEILAYNLKISESDIKLNEKVEIIL